MSWVSKLAGKPVVGVIDAFREFVDETFTSDDERKQADLLMEKVKQEPYRLQAKINMIEAGHRSRFVAGWRPFVGWVCGFGFAYHMIIQPLLLFIATTNGVDLSELPTFDTSALTTVLMGMLGLGGLRTFEKLQGKAK